MPAPAVEYFPLAPAVFQATTPVVEYFSPVPVVFTSPEPVVEYFSPAPAVFHSPVLDYIAPVPVESPSAVTDGDPQASVPGQSSTPPRGAASSECLFLGSAKLYHCRGERACDGVSPQEHWQGPLRDARPRPDRCLSMRRGETRAEETARQGKKLLLGGTGALLLVLHGVGWCADTAMWAGIALAFWGFSVVEENDDEKVFGCYLRSAGSGFSTQCYAWYHSDTCSHVSLRWFREYFTHSLHEGCLCSVFPRNAGSTVDSCSCAIGALVSSSHCSVLCSAAEYKRFGIV